MVGGIPAILLALSAIPAYFYPLSESRHAAILEELRIRREAEEVEAKKASHHHEEVDDELVDNEDVPIEN
jgi:Na+/melibiose symporter-like transporter